MDNASYYSRKTDKPPSSSSNKATITGRLEKKGVKIRGGFLKAEFLHCVQQHTSNEDSKNYVIDKIVSDNGHWVVRLPPYHCKYNPFESIWAQVKEYVNKRNTFKIIDL